MCGKAIKMSNLDFRLKFRVQILSVEDPDAHGVTRKNSEHLKDGHPTYLIIEIR